VRRQRNPTIPDRFRDDQAVSSGEERADRAPRWDTGAPAAEPDHPWPIPRRSSGVERRGTSRSSSALRHRCAGSGTRPSPTDSATIKRCRAARNEPIELRA